MLLSKLIFLFTSVLMNVSEPCPEGQGIDLEGASPLPNSEVKNPALKGGVFFRLDKGEEKWFTLPLAESYEYQILNGEGALSWSEHQKKFREQGLTVQHWEIQREIVAFQDEGELKKWIWLEMAPCVGAENQEEFVETYFRRMQEVGWFPSNDGKIRFPRERLLVLLRRD